MGSISKITYKGISIIYNDMSEAKPNESFELCMKTREMLSQYAPHSAYVLVNVRNIRFDSKVIQIIKETTRFNSPFVKTTAVFGLEGFTRVLVNVVATFSNREMKIVESFEEGQEWLFAQSLKEQKELVSQ